MENTENDRAHWVFCPCINPNPHRKLRKGDQETRGVFCAEEADFILGLALDSGEITPEEYDSLLAEFKTFGLPANDEEYMARELPIPEDLLAAGPEVNQAANDAANFGIGVVIVDAEGRPKRQNPVAAAIILGMTPPSN